MNRDWGEEGRNGFTAAIFRLHFRQFISGQNSWLSPITQTRASITRSNRNFIANPIANIEFAPRKSAELTVAGGDSGDAVRPAAALSGEIPAPGPETISTSHIYLIILFFFVMCHIRAAVIYFHIHLSFVCVCVCVCVCLCVCVFVYFLFPICVMTEWIGDELTRPDVAALTEMTSKWASKWASKWRKSELIDVN